LLAHLFLSHCPRKLRIYVEIIPELSNAKLVKVELETVSTTQKWILDLILKLTLALIPRPILDLIQKRIQDLIQKRIQDSTLVQRHAI
jgi:hypothetical protein